MIVVSDTTPLNYLILIEAAQVLPELFGRVYAPTAVIQELLDPRGLSLSERGPVHLLSGFLFRSPPRLTRRYPKRFTRGKWRPSRLLRSLGLTGF